MTCKVTYSLVKIRYPTSETTFEVNSFYKEKKMLFLKNSTSRY